MRLTTPNLSRFVRIVQLGLLHVAVTITFVLIDGVLNRVMIVDLGLLATLVAALITVPYLLSPAQMVLGQYSDSHPILGRRRTPYIALGSALCIGGMLLTPHAAYAIGDGAPWGIALGLLAFGVWGIGFNMAVVAYLSLASDLSTDDDRSQTIAIMWFMMVVGIISASLLISRALDIDATVHQIDRERLIVVFEEVAAIAAGMTLLGLLGLEPRWQPAVTRTVDRVSITRAFQAVAANPQARRFFVYMIILLAAILGQDVLLEPYGAEAFDLPVRETTRLTSIWGGAMLVGLLVAGSGLARRIGTRAGAALGGVIAAAGLGLIGTSGLLGAVELFIPGVVALGFGTGIATSTNLALMLDMTTTEQAGLFIGAWGVADALARGIGMILAGIIRDVISVSSGMVVFGYVVVFFVEVVLLLISLALLRRLDVREFRARQTSLTEWIATTGDAS
jgi:BCD family chlorophyll transporter-like MFS transporter